MVVQESWKCLYFCPSTHCWLAGWEMAKGKWQCLNRAYAAAITCLGFCRHQATSQQTQAEVCLSITDYCLAKVLLMPGGFLKENFMSIPLIHPVQ